MKSNKTVILSAIIAIGVGMGSAIASASPQAPQVLQDVRHDESRPMRDIIRELPALAPGDPAHPYEVPNIFLKPHDAAPLAEGRELSQRGMQLQPSGTPAPSTIVSFNGMSASDGGGFIPPDTNGDVSPSEYIQWINTSWAIFNKVTGARTSGPTAGSSFWAGFGGRCQTTNAGDPIALWDDRAQRWLMSQFTVPPNGSNIGSQCVAISTTSNPLGTYFRYEFQFPWFGDYPHFGIWTNANASQNAYLMTTHEFQDTPTQVFQGAAFIAFERDKMLAGLPAQVVRFPGFDAYGVEPAHLEGAFDAPAGACPSFVHFDAATSEYLFWDLCLNWTNTAASTISATPQRIAARAPFTPRFVQVPQLNSVNPLDVFGTHIMYRASTRAFPPGAPSSVSMVVNHTVEGPLQQGAIDWVQFAFQNGATSLPVGSLLADGFEEPQAVGMSKSLVDEGSYVPDGNTRWLGGIAMDKSGNIGVGYSVSSTTMNPEVRINGRTLDDPAGQLRDEQSCSPPGTGAQTSTSNRWGDYSSMSVDPSDECTFWYTNEFYPVTANSSWSTRICSFKFASCGQPNFAVVADSPTRIEMCAATAIGDPTIDLRVGVLDGFTAAVSFSASGLPGSITASFNPTVVTPTPGTSQLTLTGALATASGEYTGTVTGTAGVQTRTLPISIGISSAAAAQPTLLTPADAATGVKVRPTLSWNAVPGALSYLVQVASDAGFSSIVASAVVTSPSWAVDVGLTPSTAFFWRVSPSNYCGVGTVSAIRTFTTGVPGNCPTATVASTVFQDDFQSGINGWTVAGSGGTGWTQGAATGGTGLTTTVWRVVDNTVTSDQTLTSPNVVIPPGAQAVILSFDAYHSFETDGPNGCWDGAALEAKLLADPAFTHLGANRMFTDAYTGPVSAGAPLAGRAVWCTQTTTPPRHSIVDLDDFAGQTIQLRFRATSDSNTAGTAPTGMHIDNLKVEVCQ